MSELTHKLEDQKEWHKAVIFDQEGKVIAKKNCELAEEEIK